MIQRFKFSSYKEERYQVVKQYPSLKKERDFHTEEHFVVPWELNYDKKEYSDKEWE